MDKFDFSPWGEDSVELRALLSIFLFTLNCLPAHRNHARSHDVNCQCVFTQRIN